MYNVGEEIALTLAFGPGATGQAASVVVNLVTHSGSAATVTNITSSLTKAVKEIGSTGVYLATYTPATPVKGCIQATLSGFDSVYMEMNVSSYVTGLRNVVNASKRVVSASAATFYKTDDNTAVYATDTIATVTGTTTITRAWA